MDWRACAVWIIMVCVKKQAHFWLQSLGAGFCVPWNQWAFVDSSKTGYSLWRLTHPKLRQNGTIFNNRRFFWRAEHFQALIAIILL